MFPLTPNLAIIKCGEIVKNKQTKKTTNMLNSKKHLETTCSLPGSSWNFRCELNYIYFCFSHSRILFFPWSSGREFMTKRAAKIELSVQAIDKVQTRVAVSHLPKYRVGRYILHHQAEMPRFHRRSSWGCFILFHMCS